jgi:hypothetical protein
MGRHLSPSNPEGYEMNNFIQTKFLKKMWKDINDHFGYSYPYPDVIIKILYDENELKEVFEHSCWSDDGNIYERKIKKTIKYADAVLVAKSMQQDAFKEMGIESDFVILLADSKISSDYFVNGIQRDQLTKEWGFMNYYYFLIYHEFIHILEWLSGKHDLYQSDRQNLLMFHHFMGWDGHYQLVSL